MMMNNDPMGLPNPDNEMVVTNQSGIALVNKQEKRQ